MKVYNEEDHLSNVNKGIVDLFGSLKEKIYTLDDGIEERIRKNYIAFRKNIAFVYLHPQKSAIKMHLPIPIKKLKDPKGLATDVKGKGHHGVGETRVFLKNEDELNYVFDLIEQSYNAIK